MLPSVYDHIESEKPGEIVSAGVAVGIPKENSRNSGVIFSFSGLCNARTAEMQLRTMIDDGMREMRLIADYDFRCAIASAQVIDRPTCAFAAAPFCDKHLLGFFK